MTALAATILALSLAPVDVTAQRLAVEIDPFAHQLVAGGRLELAGAGRLELRLTASAQALSFVIGDRRLDAWETRGDRMNPDRRLHVLDIPAGTREIGFGYRATLEEDVASGERAGQAHNHAVHAHIGPEGVFLGEGSAWHPQPIDEEGLPALHWIELVISPVEGFAFVGSGDPADRTPPEVACHRWVTPRPVDGAALAGGPRTVVGRTHATLHGSVELAMLVSPEHAELAPIFLDAVTAYLDRAVPRLGAFPFRRFTILENFFSSGFAFPGFTLLGPRVVGMGARALLPGFLDHELLHCWWGNGVYLDPRLGNWCEAVTTYGANYLRREDDGGADALRDYRRTTLMKLAAEPEVLDDAAPSRFGLAGGSSRFVGYDKGAFVLAMVEDLIARRPPGDAHLDAGLRRFAADHMGRRASWDDLRASLEETYGIDLRAFWERWIHDRALPRTPTTADPSALAAFEASVAPGQRVELRRGSDAHGAWVEVDPDFRIWRVLPPEQLVPLLGAVLGAEGVRLEAPDRPEVAPLREAIAPTADGANLFLVGADAVAAQADRLARAANPIVAGPGWFEVGGTRWEQPEASVLHVLADPDAPGRAIAVFLANGEPGWRRLPLAVHYRRDTTIVWMNDQVVERRTFEPDRRLRVAP